MKACGAGRTIVIGVDSLDLDLVQRWVAAGLLPFFASQLRDCSLVRLSTPTAVLQGALWPDLVSGCSPGYHGTYFLTQLTCGTYHFDTIEADRFAAMPYYGVLDKLGVRCAVVDFPHVTPIRGFRGLHVVDWLSEFQTSGFTVQPAAQQQRLVAQFGALRQSGGYGSTVNSLDGHRKLREKLEQTLQMKSALATQLLGRTDLDHICIVYGEAHKAGHHFWKYMDPNHPDHITAEPALRHGIRDIYQLIDRHLGVLAQQVTERDNFVLFSEHGMQANYRGDQFVLPILERLGLCASASGAQAEGAAVVTTSRGSRGGGLRAALHRLLKTTAPPSAVRSLRTRFGAASGIDWSRNRVFQLPTDRNSFLRVNLRGREPEGTVTPGQEYEALLEQLEREFGALVNVDTGRPAVQAVFRIHELCPGPRVHELPDLGILWNSEAPIATVESPRLGRIHLPVQEDRTGNHRAGGFMLARGPRISRRVRRMNGHLLQLPATLLALHDVPCPDFYEMEAFDGLLLEPAVALEACRFKCPPVPVVN
ncbi:MAG: alkaline phosphatase family protein [Sinobacteraceae bacterium]|nr:alkaline phosphatase family protein [Nevskiaceae bacterium]